MTTAVSDKLWSDVLGLLGRSEHLEAIAEANLPLLWSVITPDWKHKFWQKSLQELFTCTSYKWPRDRHSFWNKVAGVDPDLRVTLQDWLILHDTHVCLSHLPNWDTIDPTTGDPDRLVHWLRSQCASTSRILLPRCWPLWTPEQRGYVLSRLLLRIDDAVVPRALWDDPLLVWPSNAFQVLQRDRPSACLLLVRHPQWTQRPLQSELERAILHDQVELLRHWLRPPPPDSSRSPCRLAEYDIQALARQVRSAPVAHLLHMYGASRAELTSQVLETLGSTADISQFTDHRLAGLVPWLRRNAGPAALARFPKIAIRLWYKDFFHASVQAMLEVVRTQELTLVRELIRDQFDDMRYRAIMSRSGSYCLRSDCLLILAAVAGRTMPEAFALVADGPHLLCWAEMGLSSFLQLVPPWDHTWDPARQALARWEQRWARAMEDSLGACPPLRRGLLFRWHQLLHHPDGGKLSTEPAGVASIAAQTLLAPFHSHSVHEFYSEG